MYLVVLVVKTEGIEDGIDAESKGHLPLVFTPWGWARDKAPAGIPGKGTKHIVVAHHDRQATAHSEALEVRSSDHPTCGVIQAVKGAIKDVLRRDATKFFLGEEDRKLTTNGALKDLGGVALTCVVDEQKTTKLKPWSERLTLGRGEAYLARAGQDRHRMARHLGVSRVEGERLRGDIDRGPQPNLPGQLIDPLGMRKGRSTMPKANQAHRGTGAQSADPRRIPAQSEGRRAAPQKTSPRQAHSTQIPRS